MMIDYISEVSIASSLFYGHVRAMSKFLVACFDIFKVLAAYSSIFKVLASFFPHLQGLVGISLHLQSLGRDSLHLQCLLGISEILMSGYSAMHPRCLSYVASENWCCCSFIIKVNIGATSIRVQVLMWSVDVACKDECWHNFNMNEVLMWLHYKDECWHSFGMNEVLVWLQGKDECCHGFSMNEV